MVYMIDPLLFCTVFKQQDNALIIHSKGQLYKITTNFSIVNSSFQMSVIK